LKLLQTGQNTYATGLEWSRSKKNAILKISVLLFNKKGVDYIFLPNLIFIFANDNIDKLFLSLCEITIKFTNTLGPKVLDFKH